MALTKCPHCGHTVLSVASHCPACSGTLGRTFLGLEHQGELAECRSCGHPVRSRTSACPHCGIEHPAGRRTSRAAVPVLAVVVLGALGLALRQSPPAPATPSTTTTTSTTASPQASARQATQPIVARPLRALEPPVRTTAPDTPAPANPPVAAAPPADTSALRTRWVADWSNMRRLPSNEAPVVRVLAPGTMVRGTPGKWGWWAILYQGDTVGYVAGALLRPTRPPGTTARPPADR